jgi:hypothetical protein
MSQTPNRLQHTFSKGPPAANTRSSTTRSRTSKSSPTVPPDPRSQSAQPPSQSPNHSPHRPSSVQPTHTYQSHSFKLSTPTHLNSPSHQHPSSSPSKHSHITGDTRYSGYEGRNTFEQIETMGNHINDIEDNINNIVDDINANISTVNRLEESINHMTTVLTKLVSKDEDKQTSSSQVKPNSQPQRHSHQSHVNVTSTQEPHTVSSDKDLSFETESISENKNMPTQIPSQTKPSYKTVLESNHAHTPKSNTLLPINTVSNNPIPHSNMDNPSHSHKTNPSHTHFHKPQPQAFQPFQTPSTPKLPTMSPTKFNSNQFFSILETNKLKYTSMETYLSKQVLTDDSYQAMEKFYNSILRTINMGLSTQLYFLPGFKELRQDTNFTSLFLDGLFGSNYDKAFTIVTSIGQFIKDRLLNTTCINKSSSPKAYIIVNAYPTVDGWTLFEMLLKKRLVHCGALPQYDLDAIRTSITFKTGESIHDFLFRIQQLENEYKLQLALHPQLVPTTKLVKRFVTELMRAPEYQSYIIHFERAIINHIKIYGEQNLDNKAPFTIMEVYETLIIYSIPEIPSNLKPSKNHIEIDSIATLPNSISNNNEKSFVAHASVDQPLIAHATTDSDNKESDNNIEEWYCQEVNNEEMDQKHIGALMQRRNFRNNNKQNNRPFCQCCMTPGHTSDHCFLRGKNFRPDALNKRINVFNQQHGDKPPQGTEIKSWNPRSPPPILQKSTSSTNNASSKPSVNFINTSPTNEATISSFIQHQNETTAYYLQQSDSDDEKSSDDEIHIGYIAQPIITNCHTSPSTISPHSFDIIPPFNTMTHVSKNTPTELILNMAKIHQNQTHPAEKYINQFSKELTQLPTDTFTNCAKLHFQLDTGANVHAVTSPHLLAFFIKKTTRVRNINGESFESPGWGASIININNSYYLISPIYLCPNNPHNTLSLGALKLFSGFKRTIIETHTQIEIHDNNNKIHNLPVTTSNGLDFVKLQIASFNPMVIQSHSKPTRNIKDAQLATYQKHIENPQSQDQQEFIFPMHVMALISAFYVHLHQSVSPRSKAVLHMNQLLNARYSPPIIHSCQTYSEHQSSQLLDQTVTADNFMYDSHNIQPIIGKLFRSVPTSKHPPLQTYMLIHLLMQHTSKSSIMKMFKKKTFQDMPNLSKMDHIDCTCEICLTSKTTKIPRGKLVNVTNLPPFTRIHCDFSFYGITSLRGYTTAFDITCASTSYTLGFPSKSKGPPITIFTWVIKTLRKMGYEVLFVRVDEDGALARSSEFCSTIVKLNCILETTGGGNSENNGKVERPNRVKADMVRSSLATAKILFGKDLPKDLPIQKFWCFAYCHANYTHRRLYNRLRDASPHLLVHKELPTLKELVIFGSNVTIVAPNKNSLKKLDERRAENGHFLSFGNHTSNILYWNKRNPYTYQRAHHAIIDEVSTFSLLKSVFHTNDIPTSEDNKNVFNNNTDDSKATELLPMVSSPFPEKDIDRFDIILPKTGTIIGIDIRDDPLLSLPYIHSCIRGTFIVDQLPAKYRRHSLIIDINGEMPITASYALSLLKDVQASKNRKLHIELVKRDTKPTTSLSISRTMFDQLPNLNNRRPMISAAMTLKDDFENHDHFISAPTKPETPKSFFDCMKGPHRRAFQAAARIQFEKNRKVVVFSKPFLRSELSPDDRVFRTLLVPGYKDTDMDGIYECRIRDCTVGTPQVKGLDFPESYCATVDSTTYKLVFAVSAMNNNTISVIDVKNAFQTSIAPPEFRIYVSVPPLYFQWLRDTENMTFIEGKSYVRQMLNANQGTKSASHVWYWLLVPILQKYGFIRSTVDHAFFIRPCPDDRHFYICLATDDLLCSHPNQLEFDNLVKHLGKYFDLSVQQGNVIKFLSLRIIQTDHAISIDQTDYICNLLRHYFGSDVDIIKTATTPMRTDSNFEKEMTNAIPLTKSELAELIITHKGGYRYHIGKFGYCTQTRPDIQFPVQRLAEHSVSPTAIAFTQIARCYRYLAKDPHRPIIYPRRPFKGTTTLSQFITPHQEIKLVIPNDLQVFADAELARNLSDRKSYYCIVIMLNAVIIEFKMKKTLSIMTHTTDAETKAQFVAVRRLQPIRRLLESMGYPCLIPTPVYTDNAAVTAIIDANRMTPRCRHIDIPIAYLHQEHTKSFRNILIRTTQMIADMGTKPLSTLLHKRFKYWLTGALFLPEPGSLHYKLLQMDLYEICFLDHPKIISNRIK